MLWKKGFTMVELLVVLIILAVLVAVAAPMYLANVDRAKASEAVAAMGTIRQAEREYNIKHSPNFLDVSAGNLPNKPEASTNKGLDINIGVPQYFCNQAYTVDVGGSSARFVGPAAASYLITVDGSQCVQTGGGTYDHDADPLTAEIANPRFSIKADDVNKYRAEMDDSGRVYVSYDSTNYSAY